MSTTSRRALKLVNLNVQCEKHIGRFLPFLQREQPDIVCLQEVFLRDLPSIERTLGMHGIFAPMTEYYRESQPDSPHEPEGLAILSRHALHGVRRDYYATGGRAPGETIAFNDESQDSLQKALLSAVVEVGSDTFRVGTTHFTWTPDGQATDLQRRDLRALLQVLSTFEHIVFCGDFNAPRGKEIFGEMAKRYYDWLPEHITTTLDQELHITKGLQHVVDTIFSSVHYMLDDVRTASGVSDHCAIIGHVRRAVGTARRDLAREEMSSR